MTDPIEPRRDARPICDYEGSTYRTDFWQGQGREYEDAVERMTLARLLPPRGRRLLDVGAGFGRLAPVYAKYDQVILFDFSRSQLEYAREHLGDRGYLYVAGDLYRLPLATDAVDTTVMVRVLHHLVDVPTAFGQIARVTRPQGTFVLEFANKRHLKNVLRYALGRGINPYDLQPHEFAPLHFDFHPRWVEGRLAEAGFTIERRLSVSLLRLGALKRLLPTGLLATLDRALQPIASPLTLGPSVFVRARTNVAGRPRLADAAHLFRCPDCGHEPLSPGDIGLRCDSCQARWAIEDGIYVFK